MRMFGSPVHLIIFDVDGVLFDILGRLVENLEETALYFGLPLAPIKQSIAEIAAGKRRIRGNARDSTRMLWPHLEERKIMMFVEYFQEVERRHPYELIKGVYEAIAFLRGYGMLLALATNNPMQSLLWRLESARIDPKWFAAIVTKDNSYFKPHPRTFDPIFAMVPVSRDNTLYVGDLQIDWDMARGGRVHFAAVLTGGVPRSAFLAEGVSDDHIFESLSDLLSHVEYRK